MSGEGWGQVGGGEAFFPGTRAQAWIHLGMRPQSLTVSVPLDGNLTRVSPFFYLPLVGAGCPGEAGAEHFPLPGQLGSDNAPAGQALANEISLKAALLGKTECSGRWEWFLPSPGESLSDIYLGTWSCSRGKSHSIVWTPLGLSPHGVFNSQTGLWWASRNSLITVQSHLPTQSQVSFSHACLLTVTTCIHLPVSPILGRVVYCVLPSLTDPRRAANFSVCLAL